VCDVQNVPTAPYQVMSNDSYLVVPPCNTLLLLVSSSSLVQESKTVQEGVQEDSDDTTTTVRLKHLLTLNKTSKLIRYAQQICRQSTHNSHEIKGLPHLFRPTIWWIVPRRKCGLFESFSDLQGKWDQIVHNVLGSKEDEDDEMTMTMRLALSLSTHGISFSSNHHHGSLSVEHAQNLIQSSSLSTSPSPTLVKDVTAIISIPIQRILSCLSHELDILFAPLLPDITAILLTQMSEAHVFTTLNILLNPTFHMRQRTKSCTTIPTSVQQHIQTCEAFSSLLRIQNKKVFYFYENVLTTTGLDPIFRYFLVPVLPYQHVMHVMDLFIIDGIKALLRLGQALLLVYYYHCNGDDTKVFEASAQDPWRAIRNFTHGNMFSWNTLVQIAYRTFPRRRSSSSSTTRDPRIEVYIPSRRVIAQIMTRQKLGEDSLHEYDTEVERQRLRMSMMELKPIPLLPWDPIRFTIAPLLSSQSLFRYHLSRWIPTKLQTSHLELIYSTRSMPSSIQSLYAFVKQAKHTIVLMQTSNNDESVVGMYASQEWSIHPRPYGDGQCFLFRLCPNPACFKWSRLKDDNASVASTVLNEQFMSATSKYIAMGGSIDGGFGLRVDDDLNKAYSTKSVTFNNDPLGGHRCRSDGFDIAFLEVYRFVQGMTGEAVR